MMSDMLNQILNDFIKEFLGEDCTCRTISDYLDMLGLEDEVRFELLDEVDRNLGPVVLEKEIKKLKLKFEV